MTRTHGLYSAFVRGDGTKEARAMHRFRDAATLSNTPLSEEDQEHIYTLILSIIPRF